MYFSEETCPNLQFLATFLGPDVQFTSEIYPHSALNVVQACALFTQVIECSTSLDHMKGQCVLIALCRRYLEQTCLSH